MAKSSSPPDSEYLKGFERKEELAKNHYFDNERVEHLMYKYVEGACTDVKLRDEIMIHASELIRQIIKAHNLGQICPGKDDASRGDLFQTAWVQIESVLYKYSARPHCQPKYNKQRPNDSLIIDQFIVAPELYKRFKQVCPVCKTRLEEGHVYYKGQSKVFNMWSQIARTVTLAYIKKESRDKKNSNVFQAHLENRTIAKNEVLNRFFTEAKELCKYNNDHQVILKVIEELYLADEKPHEGLIGKIVEKSGLPRTTVTGFLKILRLRAKEFTDSPVNEEDDQPSKENNQNMRFGTFYDPELAK